MFTIQKMSPYAIHCELNLSFAEIQHYVAQSIEAKNRHQAQLRETNAMAS